MNAEAFLKSSQRFFAIETNNLSWDLIERPELTPAEEEQLMSAAWASLFHWSAAGKPINVARAYGTVSRAALRAADGPTALRYAEKYLNACETEGAEAWDRVFALSALARSLSLQGRGVEAAQKKNEARMLVSELASAEDREICERDLDLAPWFGI